MPEKKKWLSITAVLLIIAGAVTMYNVSVRGKGRSVSSSAVDSVEVVSEEGESIDFIQDRAQKLVMQQGKNAPGSLLDMIDIETEENYADSQLWKSLTDEEAQAQIKISMENKSGAGLLRIENGNAFCVTQLTVSAVLIADNGKKKEIKKVYEYLPAFSYVWAYIGEKDSYRLQDNETEVSCRAGTVSQPVGRNVAVSLHDVTMDRDSGEIRYCISRTDDRVTDDLTVYGQIFFMDRNGDIKGISDVLESVHKDDRLKEYTNFANIPGGAEQCAVCYRTCRPLLKE